VTSANGRGGAALRLALVAVCAAACLPYLRTIPDYFVQDDFGGMQLIASKPWHTFPRWFTMPWMENIWRYTPDEIRPFTALSYQITALGQPAEPGGHHVLNIAVHAGNAVFVLLIARAAAGLSLGGATAAALVFALLPLGAESVAWITGRVDSLPAFFYLLSFYVYVLWRARGTASPRLYWWSLAWFFAALFSKQNTITMVPALAAYDLLAARRPIRVTWAWIRPYLPFALMTAGFLALRYVLLGEVLRENRLAAQRWQDAAGIIARHLHRMVWWDLSPVPAALLVFAALFTIGAVIAAARADPVQRSRWAGAAVYFGPVWLALGLAPTVAAGYESPRHAYLAAAGYAILIGLAYEALHHGVGAQRARFARRAAATAAIVLIVGLYGVRLHREVTAWRLRAAVAELATAELERQVLSAAPRTLFIVGVPVPSWEWAVPFVARPPYAGSDLTQRASIVMPHRLHCCRDEWWENETREALRAWTGSGAPVVGLYVSPQGEVRRLTDGEEPQLRELASFLPSIASRDNLDGAILDILRKLVAGRGRVMVPGRE
jgi:hypothetical protein